MNRSRLSDGSYEKQDDPGIPLTTDVSLTDQIAYGNINGVPSAAVITGETGGGSGFFYLLHIMQVQDGKATEVCQHARSATAVPSLRSP